MSNSLKIFYVATIVCSIFLNLIMKIYYKNLNIKIYLANPYASKWTAGFRRIFLHSLARSIQVLNTYIIFFNFIIFLPLYIFR